MTEYKFTVGTYNLHATAVKRNPDGVFEDIKRYMNECDVLCIEEAGSAQKILARAVRELDLELFDGFDKGGQASTPVLFKAKAADRKSFFLSPTTDVGEPGAGPDTMKAKWLNMVKFNVFGRTAWVGSIHTTPSVYIPVRKALALRQTTAAADATTALRGFQFIGGDYNSLPGSDIRRPLESAGMASAQRVLGPLSTKGNRSIDDVHYSKNRNLKPVRHWERKGVSDHDAYFVEFEVKPTAKWVRDHAPKQAEFEHIHSSSRFDRSLASLEASVRAHVADSPFITMTEVEFERREKVLRKVAREVGYGVLTGDASNANDGGILFDKERFELIYSEQFKNATQVIYRTDGHQRDLPYSTIGVFKDKSNGKVFVCSVAHYASSVEGELRANDQTYRRAIQWRQSNTNTKKRVNALAKAHKADARLIVADFNVNFKHAWVRAMIKAMATGYSSTWTNVKVAGGTHGKRLIDATLTRGALKVKGSARLYKDDASSDHRPYIETLVWS